VDITVYLPDNVGQWAKNAGLNLSATLREAIEDERQRREVRDVGGESVVHELFVDDDLGGHTVRLHGKDLFHDDGRRSGFATLYATEDGRLFVYHEGEAQLYEIDDPTDPDYGGNGLRAHFPDDAAYVAAMAAIGEKAVIDIGQA
jgi:hypothetical protein